MRESALSRSRMSACLQTAMTAFVVMLLTAAIAAQSARIPGYRCKVLYNFCSLQNCTDGRTPWAGLIEGSDGNLDGTADGGGDDGVVFKLTR